MNQIALFDAVAYLKSADPLEPEYTLFEPGDYSQAEPDYGTDSPCDGHLG
jgi:hypothetical protein